MERTVGCVCFTILAGRQGRRVELMAAFPCFIRVFFNVSTIIICLMAAVRAAADGRVGARCAVAPAAPQQLGEDCARRPRVNGAI